jgi:hypothetical protein
MSKSRSIYLFILTGLLLTSCSEDNGSATDMFGTNNPIKNTIAPSTAGNYNQWLLGNIGQYGYLETVTAGNFDAWSFYIVCSGGDLQQESNRFHWSGDVNGEVIKMDADQDDNWNNWTYRSITYNKTYYIRSARGNDMNEWNILDAHEHYLFTIKTIKEAGWNKWEITGTVPESHEENLVGLFFIPVLYATTQPVIQ